MKSAANVQTFLTALRSVSQEKISMIFERR